MRKNSVMVIAVK